MKERAIHRVLYEALTEDTGAHFLDSGGAENRHWQRNRKRTYTNFLEDPPVKYEIGGPEDFFEVEREVSTFHFLSRNFEIDETCNIWNFNRIPPEDDLDALGLTLVQDWQYTYNMQNDLSQDFQWQVWADNYYDPDLKYLKVRIHNGADARGGFTKPFVILDSVYGRELDYLKVGHMDENIELYMDEEEALVEAKAMQQFENQ